LATLVELAMNRLPLVPPVREQNWKVFLLNSQSRL